MRSAFLIVSILVAGATDLDVLTKLLAERSHIEETSSGGHSRETRLESNAESGLLTLVDEHTYFHLGAQVERLIARRHAFALADIDPGSIRVEKQEWFTPGRLNNVVIVETLNKAKTVKYTSDTEWLVRGESSEESFKGEVAGFVLAYFSPNDTANANRAVSLMKKAVIADRKLASAATR